MRNQGIPVHISKEDFLKLPPEERDWIQFEATRTIHRCGCQYGRRQWKKVFTIGGFMGLAGGFIAQVFKGWVK